jgi:Icc-related predicted phosphoesterase
VKIFFATDLHASEVCFRKFCAAAGFYGCDALVMGGDVTGKLVVPIVVEDGHARYRLGGVTHRCGRQEVPVEERRIANMGYYAVVGGPEVEDELADPQRYEARLLHEARRRLQGWAQYADGRLGPSGVPILVAPGNDDDPSIDSVFEASTVFINGEAAIRDLLGVEVASSGWSNTTPWHTPRELSEPDLECRLRTLASQLRDPEHAIFNFHVPPHGTPLDLCPELDEGLRMVTVMGAPVMAHAGSVAVRRLIEEFQPLLGLHGHIHEARGAVRLGRTLALNPGSEYSEGVLKGVIVSIDGGKVQHSFTAG